MREIVTFKQQRFTCELCERIGKAIAEIQPSRMTAAFTEIAIGLTCNSSLGFGYGLKPVAAAGASSPVAGADNAEVGAAVEGEASAGASGRYSGAASAEASRRCSGGASTDALGRSWAAPSAGLSIPSSGPAGGSEAAGGAVGLSRILMVFYSNYRHS